MKIGERNEAARRLRDEKRDDNICVVPPQPRGGKRSDRQGERAFGCQTSTVSPSSTGCGWKDERKNDLVGQQEPAHITHGRQLTSLHAPTTKEAHLPLLLRLARGPGISARWNLWCQPPGGATVPPPMPLGRCT